MSTSVEQSPSILSDAPMSAYLAAQLVHAGGWLPFDAFMHHALYAPGLGYYTAGLPKLGIRPQDGSDFATAPEMSPAFGRAIARQIIELLHTTNTDTVWEFGAGSGALAQQILHTAGAAIGRYCIVDVSGHLRARQQARLQEFGAKVQWHETLPEALSGVLLGNEVLDAMPVKLLARVGGIWHERGVALHEGALYFADALTDLRPPLGVDGGHDYLTEIHPQAEAFVCTLTERLTQGAMLWIDYGFDERSYYHPQRHMGTLMCHQQHLSDTNPLVKVGFKDITAHVNFTGIALAAQNAGAHVLGYTSQGRFLLNSGILGDLEQAQLPVRAQAMKLIAEHEMGELFKVLLLAKGLEAAPSGFAVGDRTHTL